MKVGRGSLEAELEWALKLRTDDERLTSLLGGKFVEFSTGKSGAVEGAFEYATEPLECETAAEVGREEGVRLDSRLDILFDSLLNQGRRVDTGLSAALASSIAAKDRLLPLLPLTG